MCLKLSKNRWPSRVMLRNRMQEHKSANAMHLGKQYGDKPGKENTVESSGTADGGKLDA